MSNYPFYEPHSTSPYSYPIPSLPPSYPYQYNFEETYSPLAQAAYLPPYPSPSPYPLPPSPSLPPSPFSPAALSQQQVSGEKEGEGEGKKKGFRIGHVFLILIILLAIGGVAAFLIIYYKWFKYP